MLLKINMKPRQFQFGFVTHLLLLALKSSTSRMDSIWACDDGEFNREEPASPPPCRKAASDKAVYKDCCKGSEGLRFS